MALRDTTIDPRLIESARKIFRQKGFMTAQLSEICKDAGVTTGAVYKRYKGKEELFEAIVKDTIDTMNNILITSQGTDPAKLSDKELVDTWTNSEENTMLWCKRLLEMRDGLEILLNCSEGTKYSRFHDEWLEKMSDIDYAFLKELQDRGLADKSVSRLELHVMVSAMWQLYSEPVVHGMSERDVKHHCKIAGKLFNWKEALSIKAIK